MGDPSLKYFRNPLGVQKLFSTPCVMVDGCFWDAATVFTPAPSFGGDNLEFLQSIKMKGSCPKVWMLVLVWASRGLRGDWNREPPRNWELCIRPLCLGHRSGCDVPTYINMNDSSQGARCSCAQQMQFMSRMHFKEEPRTPLKFKVCLDIFIFVPHANLVESGCSLVFCWRRWLGGKRVLPQ